MIVRNGDIIEKEISIELYKTRADVRRFLMEIFIKEDCQTKLRYFVENLSNNKHIYIDRPGRLNKGCDFVIYVEDLITWKNGNDKPPKHNNLIADILKKKEKLTVAQQSLLFQAITDIYNLEPFSIADKKLKDLPLYGWSYEVLLKLVRWFFIEQDITYWSTSGRKMLYDGIKTILPS